MNLKLRDTFLKKWKQYFGETELPFVFFYSKELHKATLAAPPDGHSCIICELSRVRKGVSLAYTAPLIRCGGAQRVFGYNDTMRPNFRYFLSCGIPGVMEGERYLRTPKMVDDFLEKAERIPAGEDYLIFKRWDRLEEEDHPEAVVFYATPDVLSGLFTLVNFEEADGNGVIAPFGSGCGTLARAWLENQKEHPKSVIGMFDPSARPCVPENTLSFSIPMKKFEKIIGYMDETFLTTDTWEKVRKRFEKE